MITSAGEDATVRVPTSVLPQLLRATEVCSSLRVGTSHGLLVLVALHRPEPAFRRQR